MIETEQNEQQKQFPEAEVHFENTSPPGLAEALASASGELLVVDAQKSQDGPKLLNYAKSEIAPDSVYAVSEQAYLLHIQQQLARYAIAAQKHDPAEVIEHSPGYRETAKTYGDLVKEIEDFRENLIFINNAEFDKATDTLAERIIFEAEAGNTVAIFEYRDRSPRYIATKVLSKVLRILDSPSNYSPEEGAVIKKRILLDYDPKSLADRAIQLGDEEHRQFYILDDFALSGTKIREASVKVKSALYSRQTNGEVKGLTICSSGAGWSSIPIESIFKPTHKAANQTGIAVAGSWSSTDYGYTNVLSRFGRLLGTHSEIDRVRNTGAQPLSHQIKGRYNRGPDGEYLDPQYAAEYAQVNDVFGVKSQDDTT